ncbi:hypothetical protein HPB47_015455 [Ixodes persulcatus]|uniref:Uncharacterized protein n=1 Tax=Ixodes persulcatus TaxID=34615 RepID=A0AC60QTG5_IXOPE|nr:hypothetical protein HPB47_015455 [Ixodes persulcatus]
MTQKLLGTLGTVRRRSLIRHLLDPTKSKSRTSQTLRKIVHNCKGTNGEIMQKLINRYLGEASSAKYPNNNDLPNPKLDRTFTEAGVVRVAQDLTRNTSLARDENQNCLLRNLDANSYFSQTQHINNVWAFNNFLRNRNTQNSYVSSNPVSPLNLDNLKPIFLTSCPGKLF